MKTFLDRPKRIKVIACATVIEEMLPFMPVDIAYATLDFGLHSNPDILRHTLQQAVDRVGKECDAIVLGYGLCAQAIVGLRAENSALVIPRVDDCIALFLGSRDAYIEQLRAEPGTYYFTKGWIETGSSPFREYERVVAKYGEARAQRIMKLLLHNYTRLAFINTGLCDLERYREYSRIIAERFQLRYEEIQGSTTLLRKMLFGPWDDEFVIVRPGETVSYQDFILV